VIDELEGIWKEVTVLRDMSWLAGFLHKVPFDNPPLQSHKLDCHWGSITTRLRLKAPFVVPFCPRTGIGRVEIGM
jgi:hypothetical protein